MAGLPRQARASGPVLGRRNWQMAPAERAAIEGLLSDLKPRLSVEIRHRPWSSLERIAAHSDAVHTFDLGAEVEQDAFPNVAFHRGDNHVLLPGSSARTQRGLRARRRRPHARGSAA